MVRKINHILAIPTIITLMLLSGCIRHTDIVMGDTPQTPKEALKGFKAVRNVETRSSNMAYGEFISKLKQVAQQCYQYELSVTQRGSFSDNNGYRQRWTGKVTNLGPGNDVFTMQSKGLKNSSVVTTKDNAKIPEDGLWIYVIEFSKAPSGTQVDMYSPSMWWDSYVNTVIDTVEGNYGNGCPPQDKRHPGAE